MFDILLRVAGCHFRMEHSWSEWNPKWKLKSILLGWIYQHIKPTEQTLSLVNHVIIRELHLQLDQFSFPPCIHISLKLPLGSHLHDFGSTNHPHHHLPLCNCHLIPNAPKTNMSLDDISWPGKKWPFMCCGIITSRGIWDGVW